MSAPYSPEDLYERIVACRRRYNLNAEDACNRVAKDLERHGILIWEVCGPWILRQVESKYFRMRGFDGGQFIDGIQSQFAVVEPEHTSSGQNRYGAQILLVAASPEVSTSGQRPGGAHFTIAAAEVAQRDHTISVPQSGPVASTEVDRSGQSLVDAQKRDVAPILTSKYAAIPRTPVAQVQVYNGKQTTNHDVSPMLALSSASVALTPINGVPTTKAPGTPWPLRHRNAWNWNREFALPEGRKRFGEITDKDLIRAGTIQQKSGETILERARACTALGTLLSDLGGGTIRAVWERSQDPLLGMAIKKLLPPPSDAA